MHLLGSKFQLQYVPARVTHGALVSHRDSFTPSHCKSSQYRRTFVSISVSLWNDLNDNVFDGEELAGFKSSLSSSISCFSSFNRLFVWGWGLRSVR